MNKIVSLVMALLLVVSNAFAQSMISTVSDPSDELAPSYSVFASVDPLILADNMIKVAQANAKLSHKMSYGRMYWNVTFEDYYAYNMYLLKCGYRVVATDVVGFPGSSWVISTVKKENITFSVWHSRDTN